MTRIPAVAGFFYPADPEELRQMVAAFLPEAPPEPPREFAAVMVPHAGYIYSGRVAGATYARTIVPPRLILLGPNHTGRGAPLSIWDRGEWQMPGGSVKVDEELCDSLKNHCPLLASDRDAHLSEHCLEVQVPFLQARNRSCRVVPVVVGTGSLAHLRSLGEAVARTVREAGEPVLIVISSDMTHYEPAADAARKDRIALERMEALDAEGLRRVVLEEGISMCGYAPAVAGLYAASELGARSGRMVLYGHSGEVSGDCEAVVGYAGMTFS